MKDSSRCSPSKNAFQNDQDDRDFLNPRNVDRPKTPLDTHQAFVENPTVEQLKIEERRRSRDEKV